MRILIAPNHFKHALRADLAAEAIARGIKRAHPDYDCILFPMADGGDGTSQLLHHHLGGSVIEADAMDALERRIRATYYLTDEGRTAIIDMAAASGIGWLNRDELDPLHAHSYGTGLLIRDALERGVTRVIIGVGGSATNDGGMGILRALGVQFWTDEGTEIIYPADLHQLMMINTSGLDPRLASCDITVLCDVRNPLLGIDGATAVFGPQKGVTTAMQEILERGLDRFAHKTELLTGRPIRSIMHGGAAGGGAAGMFAFMHARLVDGIGFFLEHTGFERALRQSDLVVTGEGSLDAQTLQGKGPFGVALMAKNMGKPVIGLAGRIADAEQLSPYFSKLIGISQEESSLEEMLAKTAENLEKAGSSLF